MKVPFYTPKEYLDAPTFNGSVGAVSGGIAALGAAMAYPGLVSPEAMTLTTSGLVATAGLPSPFGVLFNSGILAQAHGTVNNADTTSYAVNFSGTVPGSGSQTAYLLASYTTVQQGAYTVIGPPPGHPDYDPTYVPVTAYNYTTDSLSLTASTTAPDNLTTFELARTTMTAGMVTLGSFLTTGQLRAGPRTVQPPLPVTGVVAPGVAGAGKTYVFTASGSLTLPLASGCVGVVFSIASNTSGAVTLNTTAPNLFFGYGSVATSGVASITVPNDSLLTVQAMIGPSPSSGQWNVTGGSLTGLSSALITSIVAGSGLAGGGVSGAVTLSQASIGAGQISSNLTGGAAIPVGNGISSIFDSLFSSASGAILQRGPSTWQALAIGTSGYVPRSTGSQVLWVPPPVPQPGMISVSDASYNITIADLGKTILAGTSVAGGFTIQLPAAASAGADWYIIIKLSTAVDTYFNLTSAGGAIDGYSRRGMGTGTSVTLMSDGTQWYTVAGLYSARSSNFSLSANSVFIFSHGLGATAEIVDATLSWVCVSIDQAYSVGDVIDSVSMIQGSTTWNITAATDIGGSSSRVFTGDTIVAANKSTKVMSVLDYTKWRLVIKVQAY